MMLAAHTIDQTEAEMRRDFEAQRADGHAWVEANSGHPEHHRQLDAVLDAAWMNAMRHLEVVRLKVDEEALH